MQSAPAAPSGSAQFSSLSWMECWPYLAHSWDSVLGTSCGVQLQGPAESVQVCRKLAVHLVSATIYRGALRHLHLHGPQQALAGFSYSPRILRTARSRSGAVR